MSEYTVWAPVEFYRSQKRVDISQDTMQDLHTKLSAAKPVAELSCALARNELSNGQAWAIPTPFEAGRHSIKRAANDHLTVHDVPFIGLPATPMPLLAGATRWRSLPS